MKALKEKSETFTRAFDKYMVDLKAKKAECLEEYNFHISFHKEVSKSSNLALRNLAFVSQGTVTVSGEWLMQKGYMHRYRGILNSLHIY